MNPEISVIIPNWNGEGYLKNCLLSLGNQSFRNFEIVVVDNGSTDGSLSMMKNIFPQVRIIGFTENRGFCAAVNIGIENSTGEIIFLLNNDTEADANCLAAVASAFSEDKEKMYSSAAVKALYLSDRNIINFAGDIYSIYGLAHQRGKGESDTGQYSKKEPVFGACAGAAGYRREALKKIGLFDESFFAYLEDVDWSFRAQLSGIKCVYLPEAMVYHADGGTSKKLNNFSLYYTVRNNLYVLFKNLPLRLLILIMPFLIIGQLRYFFMGLKRRKLRVISRAYVDFLKKIPDILYKRRVIQRKRVVSIFYLLSIMHKRYPFSLFKSFKEIAGF